MGKVFLALVCVLAIAGTLSAQNQDTSGLPGYFPEAAEIGAFSRIPGAGFEDAAGLAKVADGGLVSSVGFTRYARADYSGASPLSIEVFTLLDFKAAYSLLTLLRENPVQAGPPGDAFTTGNNGLLFAQGRFFVRIGSPLGKDTPKELLEKSAAAAGAKIMPSGGERPELLDYFPPNGFDASSLRYFPSADAYKIWTKGKAPEYIGANYDTEIATARYFTDGNSGTIFMLKFPTPELAEEYYDELAFSASAPPEGSSIYARRAGPLVAVLEGNFNTVSAGRLLSDVKFSYSMRWVYGDEKNTGVVWGIPGVVLSAVVNSLIFSFIAVIVAILIGSSIGLGRFALRQYREKRSPKSLEDDPRFTRLNLR